MPFFVVTDEASAVSNKGCPAIKNARDNHILWEKQNGYDPFLDWSEKDENI